MLEYLITFLCLGTSPQYNNACVQTLKAASISTNVKSNIDLLQEKVQKEVVKRTGTTVWSIGLTIYEVHAKNQITINTGAEPFASNVSSIINMDSIITTVTWTF